MARTIKVNNIEETTRIVVLNVIGLREITLKFLIESPATYQAIAESKGLIRAIMRPQNTEEAEQGESKESELLCDVCGKLADQGMTIRRTLERSLTQKSWIELSEVIDRLPYATLLRLYRTLCDMVERSIVANMEQEARENGL